MLQELNSFSQTHLPLFLSTQSLTNSALIFLASQFQSLSTTSSNANAKAEVNKIWKSLFVVSLPCFALLGLIEFVESGRLKLNTTGEREGAEAEEEERGEVLDSAGLDDRIMEMCLRVLDGETQGGEELEVVKRVVVRPC